MKRTKSVEYAVELIIDLMGDQMFSCDDFVSELQRAVADRAKDVKQHPEDWTPEEREYWLDEDAGMQRISFIPAVFPAVFPPRV